MCCTTFLIWTGAISFLCIQKASLAETVSAQAAPGQRERAREREREKEKKEKERERKGKRVRDRDKSRDRETFVSAEDQKKKEHLKESGTNNLKVFIQDL